MSPAATTIKVFASYLGILGMLLIMAPNMLLSTVSLPPTSEVWIRVLGVVTIILGGYYWLAAQHEATWFFRLSVYARACVPIAFAVFAGLGLVSPMIILFGGLDLAGAAWTLIALRRGTT